MHRFVKFFAIVVFISLSIAVLTVATVRIWEPYAIGWSSKKLAALGNVEAIYPVDKKLGTIDTRVGKSFKISDEITMQIPWQNAENRNDQGEVLVVTDSATDARIIAYKEQVTFKEEIPYEILSEFFNGSEYVTEYDFFVKTLPLAKDDIRYFSPRAEIIRTSFLLAAKPLMMLTSAEEAYHFENQHGVRGFEFRQSDSPDSTYVTIFTPMDTRYTLLFASTTSETIDFVLQSLKEVEK